MDTPADDASRAGCRALGLAAAYLAVSLAWRVVMEGLTGLAIVVLMTQQGVPLKGLTPAVISAHSSADLVAIASLVQLFGLLAIAVFMARWLGPDRLEAFALKPVPAVFLVLTALGGATVGFFPGWVAQVLAKLLPFLDLGDLGMLNDLLLQSSWHGRLLMLIAVVGVAPFVEEAIFRGFLWRALEGALPPWGIWLATSALFALYHVDPIHVMAVFFTGLFLGWLRWASGSVIPGMLAHLVNNGLAAVLVLALPVDPDATNPWWAAVLSVAVTAAIAAALWRVRSREAT